MTRQTGEFESNWAKRHPLETATLVGGLIGFIATIWGEHAHILPIVEMTSLDVNIPHIIGFHFFLDATRGVGAVAGGLVGGMLSQARR